MSLVFEEQYKNIVGLLMEGLEFYGKEENYQQQSLGGDSISYIELDKGKQARSILDQVDKLFEMVQDFENDYENIIKAAENEQADPQKLLEELKNFKDGHQI